MWRWRGEGSWSWRMRVRCCLREEALWRCGWREERAMHVLLYPLPFQNVSREYACTYRVLPSPPSNYRHPPRVNITSDT